MCLVSCIIPVYNLESKVQKCVESLQAQTLKDIEIILVNDCSTDHTLEVLLEYEAKNCNIKVINLPYNMRQGGARNKGLEKACGKYVIFIDGDDWIESDMLEKLYCYAEKEGCDIVDSDYYQEDQWGNYTIRKSIPDVVIDSAEKKQLMIHAGRVWTKLFRRDLLINNDIKFIEHKKFEDNPYLPIVMSYVNKVGKVSIPFYHYIYNPDSTSRKNNDYSVFDRLDTAIFLLHESKRRGIYKLYKEEIDYLFILLYYTNTIVTCLTSFDIPEYSYITKVYTNINRLLPEYKKNKYIKNSPFYVRCLVKANLAFLKILTKIIQILLMFGMKKCIVKIGKKI